MNLYCFGEDYEYDTFLLVKEFFPGEEIVRQSSDSDAFAVEDKTLRVSYYKDRTIAEFEAPSQDVRLEFPLEGYLAGARHDTENNKEDYSDSKKEYKKEYKKAHMKNLYRALSEITGMELPWGSLTGVRPTKLARTMYEDGASDDEVYEYYRKERNVSDEKARLAMEIAKTEGKIIASTSSFDGYSLYIGIPFCPTRCLYCSFLSNTIEKWQNRVDEYLDCIEKELRFVKELHPSKGPDTVYIGGGTPTALSGRELDELMNRIARHIDLSPEGGLKEFTVEAGRPDSITSEKLRILKAAGVSRISVNPQTMNDETLALIGRKHTTAQTLEAYEMARDAGFDNINMDIIIGLPGETVSSVERTMEQIIRCRPDSLTVHSLAVKRSSLLKMQLLDEEQRSAKVHNTAGNSSDALNQADSVRHNSVTDPVEMMKIAYRGAGELKLHPYYLYRQKNIAGNLENVGFAEEGKYGIYNILMMEEVQSILALGAGTVSKKVSSPREIARCDTAKDIGLYMDHIDEMIERKRELFTGSGETE